MCVGGVDMWQSHVQSHIQESPVTIMCSNCNGTGFIETGSVDITELEERLSDILDKCEDILEKCKDIFKRVSK